MGNTSPDAIFFPDAVDRVGQVQAHLATQAASVQTAISGLRTEADAASADIYSMPGMAVSNGQEVQAVSATSWALLPGLTPITMAFERPALVLVTLGAWMVASAGDLRVGISLSGATVQDANIPNWGQVAYLSAGGTTTVQNTVQKIVTVNAGTTNFNAVAYQNGGGTKRANYATLQVAPIRWAAAP